MHDFLKINYGSGKVKIVAKWRHPAFICVTADPEYHRITRLILHEWR